MSRKPWTKDVVRIERLGTVQFRLHLECGHHVDQRWKNIDGDEVIADASFRPSATVRACPECKAIHAGKKATTQADKDEENTSQPLAAGIPEAPPEPSRELAVLPSHTFTLEPSISSPVASLNKKDFAARAKKLTPEQLLRLIKHSHEQAAMSFGRGLEWAFTCGRYLLWMKEKKVLKHGEYESWVNNNCPFKIRQAQRYTRLVAKWEEIEAKATSEDAFPKNSVAALLEYVKEEAQPATVEETPPEPPQQAGSDKATPLSAAGDVGTTEDDIPAESPQESAPDNATQPSPADADGAVEDTLDDAAEADKAPPAPEIITFATRGVRPEVDVLPKQPKPRKPKADKPQRHRHNFSMAGSARVRQQKPDCLMMELCEPKSNSVFPYTTSWHFGLPLSMAKALHANLGELIERNEGANAGELE